MKTSRQRDFHNLLKYSQFRNSERSESLADLHFQNSHGRRRIYRSTLRDLQSAALQSGPTLTIFHKHVIRLIIIGHASRYFRVVRCIMRKGIERKRMSSLGKNNPTFLLYVLPRSISPGMPPAIR